MVETKYGKHVMKAPVGLAPQRHPSPSLQYSAASCGVNAGWNLVPVARPLIMPEGPPESGFPRFLFFLGGDPQNIGDFQAKIEVPLGPQREQRLITSPTVLYISPGLAYGPVDYQRVDKPVLQMDIYFGSESGDTSVSPDSAELVDSKVIHNLEEIETGTARYDRHLAKAPVQPAHQGPPISTMRFFFSEFGINATCILVPVLQPRLMEEQPHKHDFHQFLCFLGGNPLNIGDFEAEIEVWLGEEGEKHTITSPTILHYPPGLVHNPLNYKRVGRPVFHLDIFFANEYLKIPVTR